MLNTLHQMGIAAILSLIVALIPGAMGLVYAIRPTETNLALMRPLSLAGLFGGLGGLLVGLINGLRSSSMRGVPLESPAVMMGIAEALVPLCVAFGSLTAAWLMVALGMRRHAHP